jgi:hypothetical protein
MGQAKRRGTFDERRVEGEFKRAVLRQKFDAWAAEVEAFRKTFGLDVGIIGGAPPEARIVVCKIDELKKRLLGLTDAPKKEEPDGIRSTTQNPTHPDEA